MNLFVSYFILAIASSASLVEGKHQAALLRGGNNSTSDDDTSHRRNLEPLTLSLCDNRVVVDGECVNLSCVSGVCTIDDEEEEENVLQTRSCGLELGLDGCTKDSHCKEGTCDRNGRCTLEIGGYGCSEDIHCVGEGVCTGSRCGLVLTLCETELVDGECIKLKNNEVCNSPDDCVSGFCTRTPEDDNVLNIKTCGVSLGQSGCTEDSHCKEGTCNGNGKCTLGINEHGCSEDIHCESGVCINSECQLVGIGESGCHEEDINCVFGACDNNECVLQSNGNYCDENEDCESGYCDVRYTTCANPLPDQLEDESDVVRVAYRNDGAYHPTTVEIWIKDLDGNTLDHKKERPDRNLGYEKHVHFVTEILRGKPEYKIKIKVDIESGETKRKEFTIRSAVFDDYSDSGWACFKTSGTTLQNNRIKRSDNGSTDDWDGARCSGK